MTMEYEIILRPLAEEDGGGWAAYVPDLPGCMGDGESREEALRDVEGAIQSWIETAKELGEAIPKPSRRTEYSGKFTLRMPKSLHESLDKKARDDGVSLNQTCIHLLSLGLGASWRPKRKSQDTAKVVTTVPLTSSSHWSVPGVHMMNPDALANWGLEHPDQLPVVVLPAMSGQPDRRRKAGRPIGYMHTTDGRTIPIDLATGQPYPLRRGQYRKSVDHSPSKS